MAVGDFILTWDWDTANFQSVNLNATTGSATAGLQSVERGVAKNVMSIPVPNKNAIGFDIGFSDADELNVYTILTDGATIGSTYNRLMKAVKYKKHVNLSTGKTGTAFGNTGYSFLLSWEHDDWTELLYVLVKSINFTFTPGHGNVVNMRMTLQIVNKPDATSDDNPYEG